MIPTPSNGDPDATYATCYQAATDPRLAGTVDLATWFRDIPETENARAFAAWGDSTITNEQGSWLCKESGVNPDGAELFVRDLACIGKGEYIGLSAWMHAVTTDGAMNWHFLGWIAKT